MVNTSLFRPAPTSPSLICAALALACADEGEGGDELGDAGSEPAIEVVTYAAQPMVVDLVFDQPGLTVSATHGSDPGVRFATLPDEGGEETRVRARGLAPGAMHEVQWQIEELDVSGSESFTTEAALPGFVASFPVEGEGTLDEYLLFDLLSLSPEAPSSLVVLDGEGRTRWHIGRPNTTVDPSIVYAGAKLRPDGSLLYLRDYSIVILDELGETRLALDSESLGVPGLHHDVVELDSGNFLTMSYTYRDVEYEGEGTVPVAGDLLLEVTPMGEVVWTWDSFDHLDPQRTLPGFEELIVDPATKAEYQDWTHGNGLVYEAESDSILFSLRHQDWLIRVDRETGEVLWRFGEAGDFSLNEGSWPYHQHSPQWQADGTLLLYDNGIHNPNLPLAEQSSRAVRYALDFEAMTATQVWEDAAEPFMAPIAGDADRLADGSLLITDSSIGMLDGEIRARVRKVDEGTPATPLWSFTTEVGTFIYRCVATERLPGEI